LKALASKCEGHQMNSLRNRKLTIAGVVASALALSSAVTLANTVAFEGVTINLTADADTVFLTLSNVASSTGTWANAVALDAFSFNNFGSGTLGAEALGGFLGPFPGVLNSGACASSKGTPESCYSGYMAVSDTPMSFEIAYSGVFDVNAATLKLHFVDGNGKKVGSLYSSSVSPVPEPASYALMLAGLGVVGFVAQRRRR
jgi:hypothetical protein